MGRARPTGDLSEFQGMRDPYEVLGVSKVGKPGRHQEGLSQACEEAAPGLPTRTTRRRRPSSPRLNGAYEIVGDEDKRKKFDRGEIDAEGKPRFQGFEGFGGRPGAGPFGGREENFESFTWGPDGIARRSGSRGGGPGGAGFEDILSQHLRERVAARGGPGATFEAEDIGSRTSWAGRHRERDDHAERSRARRHATHRAADRQGSRVQDPARASRTASRSA